MPLIGLLSDSHGQAAATHRGVAALLDKGVNILLHLGDIGSVAVIDTLIVDGIESRLVFGNTDYDREDLKRYARNLGITVDDTAGRLELGNGRQLIYTHGHNPQFLAQALAEHVAYFCHGHTHQKRDERCGRTRLINPGALSRATEYTVARLDTNEDTLVFCEVGKNR